MLLLAATKRPDSLGGYDLYVSHKQADGKWSEPVNLGPEINSPERELSPKLTPDGKYLIWTSCRLAALAAKPPTRTTDQTYMTTKRRGKNKIIYKFDVVPTAQQVIELYNDADLPRPTNDPQRIR